jgi:hypothetical protein
MRALNNSSTQLPNVNRIVPNMYLVFDGYSSDGKSSSDRKYLGGQGTMEYKSKMMTEQSIFFQPAFLWDGIKQLAGRLELSNDVLHFYFDNFKDSKLDLKIGLTGIIKTKLYSLYGLVPTGLEISDDQGRTYIFILHDPKKLMSLLQKDIKSN